MFTLHFYVNGQIKKVKIAYYHNAFSANEGDTRTENLACHLRSHITENPLIKEIKINGASIPDATWLSL